MARPKLYSQGTRKLWTSIPEVDARLIESRALGTGDSVQVWLREAAVQRLVAEGIEPERLESVTVGSTQCRRRIETEP